MVTEMVAFVYLYSDSETNHPGKAYFKHCHQSKRYVWSTKSQTVAIHRLRCEFWPKCISVFVTGKFITRIPSSSRFYLFLFSAFGLLRPQRTAEPMSFPEGKTEQT